MARFNSGAKTLSISNTSTLSYAFTGGIITLGGAGNYTVTIANPVYFPGTSQTFYNSSTANITLSTPAGTIGGNGLTAASTQILPSLSSYTLVSDGTNYVVVNNEGGPISRTSGTFSSTLSAATSVTSPTMQGATTASGTLTIKSTSNGTKATAGILMVDGISSTSYQTGTLVVTGGLGVSENIRSNGTIYGNLSSTNVTLSTTGTINGISIGATTRSTGAFTTLDANSTVGLSPAGASVTISPSGAGTVTIAPATAGSINNMTIGASTATTGTFTTMTATTATLTNGTISTAPTNGTDIANKTYVDSSVKKITGFGYFYGAM